MARSRLIPALVLMLAVGSNAGFAQGKGQDKGKQEDKKSQASKQDNGPAKYDQGKNKDQDKRADKHDIKYENKNDNKDKSKAKVNGTVKYESSKTDYKGRDGYSKGAYRRAVYARDVQPGIRRYFTSGRTPERVAAGAVAYAFARGIDQNTLVIDNSSNRVRVKNRQGNILVDLDDERARNVGAWDVRPYRDDDVKSDGPAFCRSGAGHPNWGRQWCVDKGFGLGLNNDVRWGRTTSNVDNIVFARPAVDKETLLRDALISTLGPVVLDRLGLHALTMGYTEPVTGTWVAQPTGARVLMLNSGTYPVAEVVDVNRDNRADMMLVALRPW